MIGIAVDESTGSAFTPVPDPVDVTPRPLAAAPDGDCSRRAAQ